MRPEARATSTTATTAVGRPGPPGVFRCPGCPGEVSRADAGGVCTACRRPFGILGGRIVDFLGEPGPSAEEMLLWPPGAVGRLGPLLEQAESGGSMTSDARSELEGLGLAGPGPSLTPLGRKVRYQLLEYEWQAGDAQFRSCLDLGGLGKGSRVLDIGCGAGQTLRLLADRSPSLRVGVDYDAEVLALGRLAADDEGQAIEFGRATAHELPFLDGQFTHVLCRVALNYMHQRRALAEMVRVLEPGGFLYLRVERVWYDLRLLGRARGGREALCRLRDLGYGLAHAATGWQPTPGRRASGGRIFATLGGLSRRLERGHLEVLRAEGSGRCPRYLGLSTQGILLARRRPGPGPETGGDDTWPT